MVQKNSFARFIYNGKFRITVKQESVMRIVFRIVNLIIVSCSLFVVISLWPNYDNEYPIFTDITLPLFLPSFFMLFFSTPCILLTLYLKKEFVIIKVFSVILIYCISAVFAASMLEFTFYGNILICVFFSLFAWLHFIYYIAISKSWLN